MFLFFWQVVYLGCYVWLGCHWQKSNRHNSPRLVSFLFPIHVSSNASLLQLNSKARCPLCGSGLVFWLGVLFVGWQGDMKIMRKNHGAWSRYLVKHCNLQATSLPLNHVSFFFFRQAFFSSCKFLLEFFVEVCGMVGPWALDASTLFRKFWQAARS